MARLTPVASFISVLPSSPIMSKMVSLPPLPPAPTGPPLKAPPFDPAMTPEQLDSAITAELEKNENFPDEFPVKQTIGEFELMRPRTFALGHAAAPLLNEYADTGCPVDCGPDWTVQQITLLLERGAHISAKKKDAIAQLQLETAEKVAGGYARVVKWKDIRNCLPAKFKLSPIAMIPHKSKKYRAILDLSFNLFHNGKKYTSVNDMTNKKAPKEAMVQLGHCLQRMVTTLADNFDKQRPFYFAKLDIKDGFWRIKVSNDDAWNFCYALPVEKPTASLDNIEIVVPNSLQMGWCESPPFFCASTETARDVMSTIFARDDLPYHEMENIMLSILHPILDHSITQEAVVATKLLEVFVDDFVGMANATNLPHFRQLSRAMLHGVHSIFTPPHISNHDGGDPISEKKMNQGDGTWNTTKEILGWEFDGAEYTIKLPNQKCNEIIKMIRKLIKQKRASLNKFQKMAGKLQHASFGLPGGTSLFSPIQRAMAGDPDFINITPDIKQVLQDWRYIIQIMMKQPTSVLQLVVNYPDYIGYSDACRLGAGGIWCSGLKTLQPFLWQLRWPNDVINRLVTVDNPTGDLSINDLELAGAVLNWLALECQGIPLAYHHLATFCDNTSAVSWATKLRTSKSVVAGRLLRMLGMRIHKRMASSLVPVSIAGDKNDMADIVSRAFKDGKYFAALNNLTDYFNLHFPLPQNASWQEYTLPKKLASRVISCLRGELLPLESLLRLPAIESNTGAAGPSTQSSASVTPSSLMSAQWNETSSLQLTLQGSGQVTTVGELKSKLALSRMRSRPSPRPLNWLENKVPYTKRKGNTR